MLSIRDLSKSFAESGRPVLQNLYLELRQGDFCVVIGSNGSGKSTLLKIISGEYRDYSGTIQVDGKPLSGKYRNIASVTQEVNRGTVPALTLLENLVLSTSGHRQGKTFYRYEEQHIRNLLKGLNLGLEDYIHKPLAYLSGGQRQMVATLMAVAAKPSLLLLDEHTSALDPRMQQVVMQYSVNAIASQGITTVMVTHNLRDALTFGNRLIMLHQGQVVLDVSGKEKNRLQVTQLLDLFHSMEDRLLTEQVA